MSAAAPKVWTVLDLLRWTDVEAPTSAGRWEFEHPEAGIYGVPSAECRVPSGSTGERRGQ